MNKRIGLLITILVIVGAGIYFLTSTPQAEPPNQSSSQPPATSQGIAEPGSAVHDVQGKPIAPPPATPPPPGISFSGTILAGQTSKIYAFGQADYEKALASDKLIVLYFYANWCPICRAEVPGELFPAFNELVTDQVIGFRVNFNDNETNDAERDLAREFGVAYQHTKIFLKGGQRILKSPETWDKDRYLSEINNALK